MTMSSNESGPFGIADSGQDSVDVKEENVKVLPTFDQKSNSSGPNTESNVDNFIQQLSSDELDLSIEIFKQLQKALTNADESKSIGEFAESDREIKLEKQSGKVLNDPSQTCSSNESNTERNIHKFKHELSYDEIDISIEIVKQLQKTFFDPNEPEKFRESLESDRQIKSEVVLSDPLKCSEEQKFSSQLACAIGSYTYNNVNELGVKSSDNEMKLSIEIIEQIQKAFEQPDDDGKCPGTHRDIQQEKKSVSAVVNPVEFLEDQKSHSLGCSGKCNDIIARCQEDKNLDQSSSNIISNITSYFPDLLSSEREDRPEDSSSIYGLDVYGINSSNIKQRNAEKMSSFAPLEASLNNYKVSKDISEPSCVEKNLDCKTCSAESSKRGMPFECRTCGPKLARNGNFKRGAEFTQSSSLKQYMKTHTSERSFDCKICGAAFKQYNHLKEHRTIHTGERTFECKSCGAKFTHSKSLKLHTRIHTGERPYECKTCGDKFRQFGHLKKHIRRHTGERPFECKICGAKFTQSTCLKQHIRIHTGERPFECKSCEAKFTQSSSLKYHMRIHTSEGPFECKSCGAKFKQTSNLTQHMKLHKG